MLSVGLIGLGHMGVSIARKLLAAGYPLAVHNRTKEKANNLLQLGASWCDSPRKLAERSDVIITMVASDEAVEAISTGADGFLAGLKTSKILIEMSTLSPGKVKSLQEQVRNYEAAMLHCPVLGGPVDIYNGSASIFAGGARSVFTASQAVLEDITEHVYYVGEITRATRMKFALNIMLTHYFMGLSSSLNFARAAELPAYLVHDVITRIAEPVVRKMGEKMLHNEKGVTFSIDNFAKDQRYFLDAAKELNLNLPTIEAVSELAEEALDKGLGEDDFTTLNSLLFNEDDQS